MGQQMQFRWHADASVYVRGTPISRPFGTRAESFRAIASVPTDLATARLGAALVVGDAFCVSATPLPEGVTVAPPDFLTLTGGSTGAPKIIHRSQASWMASFDINARLFNLNPADTVAIPGQLNHSLALYGLLEALHLGMDAHVVEGLRPSGLRQALADNRISVLYATPTQLNMLLQGADTPLPGVRLILCGGGALNEVARMQVAKIFPNADLRVFYGSAETSFITISDAQTPRGSVGQAYPGVEIQIDAGEVFVRSPYLFRGYASGHQAKWKEGRISVGELGSMDANGQLRILGRKDRAITIADQTVHPEAIEDRVAARFEGLACAAVAMTDALRGLRLALVVEAEQNTALSRSIQRVIRTELGPIATPSDVLFRSELPRSSSGKVDFSVLQDWVEGNR